MLLSLWFTFYYGYASLVIFSLELFYYLVVILSNFIIKNVAEVEINASCEASELQKTKATAAINNIFSVLIQYSELTGKVVSRQRCCFSGNSRLNTSINLSLGRIKQSFVL